MLQYLLDRIKIKKCAICLLLLFILLPFNSYSQEKSVNGEKLDYNVYYRFPLSVGFEYQSLSPFRDYGGVFNIYDLSLKVRVPLPGLPVFQPLLKCGITGYDSQNPDNPEKWDHRHYYGAIGFGYSNRFSKNFEVGIDLLGGFSEAVFPNLLPDQGPVGSQNIIAEVGMRVGLNPSYNFNISINLNIRYLYSLSPLKDFNGLIFGIGFSANYRFGQIKMRQGKLWKKEDYNRLGIAYAMFH